MTMERRAPVVQWSYYQLGQVIRNASPKLVNHPQLVLIHDESKEEIKVSASEQGQRDYFAAYVVIIDDEFEAPVAFISSM